jgi:transcriptional regulator with XRE-family HTH domain
MRLETYLAENGLKPAEFAARMGKPASTVSRVLRGEREPSMALLRAIKLATNGAVTPNDFLQPVAPSQSEGAGA